MKYCLLTIALFVAFCSSSQVLETRYAIETTLDKKTPVAYENNYGSLKISSNSGELNFFTDLTNIKTGNKRIDSLLAEVNQIQFFFSGNLSQGLFGIINEQNDDRYHKVIGTISVGNVTYPAEAYVRINNLSDKSDISKALLDLRLEVNPLVVKIPVLSDYFSNILLFQVIDGVINQNR